MGSVVVECCLMAECGQWLWNTGSLLSGSVVIERWDLVGWGCWWLRVGSWLCGFDGG